MQCNKHEWDVLAHACIDGRFIKKTVNWICKKTDNVFDFRTGVGGSKPIIDSLFDRGDFFEVIRSSVKLHNIKEIWLFDHIDCGAYGGSKRFSNSRKEKSFHKKKLTEAAKIINEEFGGLKVRKFYVDWKRVWEFEELDQK